VIDCDDHTRSLLTISTFILSLLPTGGHPLRVTLTILINSKPAKLLEVCRIACVQLLTCNVIHSILFDSFVYFHFHNKTFGINK